MFIASNGACILAGSVCCQYVCDTLTGQMILETVRPDECSHQSSSEDDFADSEMHPSATDVQAALSLAESFFTGKDNADSICTSLRNVLSVVPCENKKAHQGDRFLFM